MSTYLLSTGFQKKTLAEIKSELETEAQAVFGMDIDLDPDQPLGQWVGLRAYRDAQIWDLMEEIVNSRSPDRASGTSLDFIVSENNLTRLPALSTTVQNVILYGSVGISILAGKRIKSSKNDIEFLLDSLVTLELTKAVYSRIIFDTFTVGATYTITLNGIDYSIVAAVDEVTTWGLMKTAITDITFTTTVSDKEFIIERSTEYVIALGLLLEMDEIGNYGNFTCELQGVYPAPASSLTVIVTPVSGWNRVNNPTAGFTGRLAETDSAFRIRRLANLGGIGAATEDSIRSAILTNVSGVNGCSIYSNRTATTDIDGRPPHSFEVVVSGGTNARIAEVIWEKMPAGILSFGSISETITDSQGFSQIISFNRPTTIYIHCAILRSLYSEEIYPVDGDTLIKQAIVDWSLDTNNIDVGKDVIIQRLMIPIYTVPGISSVSIEIAATPNPVDTPVFDTINIPITVRQIANFDVNRISVGAL